MQVWEHIRDKNYYIVMGTANNRTPGEKDQVVIVYRPLYESDIELFVREKNDFMSKFRPVKICDGYPERLKKKPVE